MPIPATRTELNECIRTSFRRLQDELDAAGHRVGSVPCVDQWSVKDLLAVRAWWSNSTVDWIEAGKRGECPITPAEGYRWTDTPRLNADVVRKCRRESYRSVLGRLQRGYERAIDVIESLDDRQLLDIGVFPWAGNYPIARWMSINTARQYTTARSFIRRALREHRE